MVRRHMKIDILPRGRSSLLASPFVGNAVEACHDCLVHSFRRILCVLNTPTICAHIAGVVDKVDLLGRKMAELDKSEVRAPVPAWLLDVGSHAAKNVAAENPCSAVTAGAEAANDHKKFYTRRTMMWVTELERMSEAVGVHLRLDVDHVRGRVSAGRRHAARQILGEQVSRTEQCAFFDEQNVVHYRPCAPERGVLDAKLKGQRKATSLREQCRSRSVSFDIQSQCVHSRRMNTGYFNDSPTSLQYPFSPPSPPRRILFSCILYMPLSGVKECRLRCNRCANVPVNNHAARVRTTDGRVAGALPWSECVSRWRPQGGATGWGLWRRNCRPYEHQRMELCLRPTAPVCASLKHHRQSSLLNDFSCRFLCNPITVANADANANKKANITRSVHLVPSVGARPGLLLPASVGIWCRLTDEGYWVLAKYPRGPRGW